MPTSRLKHAVAVTRLTGGARPMVNMCHRQFKAEHGSPDFKQIQKNGGVHSARIGQENRLGRLLIFAPLPEETLPECQMRRAYFCTTHPLLKHPPGLQIASCPM